MESLNELLFDYVNEEDVDKQFDILLKINAILPESERLKIPSLVTRDYIRKVLMEIKEGITT